MENILMGAKLGHQGRRVMDALAEGRRFRRREGGWAAGALVAPDSLAADLVRRGWIALPDSGPDSRPDRGPVLTERGRLWQHRQAEAPRPMPQAERAAPCPAGERPARGVTTHPAESPLGWLRARGLVDERQFEAGERLRGDWTIAGMAPRVTMRWDAAPVSAGRSPAGTLDPTLAQIAARRRMDAALDAAGPGLRDMLWRIVCAGEGMTGAERALGWPARAGRVVLTIALDRLAEHYRLPRPPGGGTPAQNGPPCEDRTANADGRLSSDASRVAKQAGRNAPSSQHDII